MNVNGIPPALARFATTAPPATRSAREARDAERAEAADRDPAAGVLADDPIRPAELRAASLWDLLSPDERAFFSDAKQLGALTYGPRGRSTETAAAPTGQRVDFKA